MAARNTRMDPPCSADELAFNPGATPGALNKVIAVTGTFQYDLWANVITRLEVRWDHNAGGTGPTFGGEAPAGIAAGNGFAAPNKNNEVLIAANVIYKF